MICSSEAFSSDILEEDLGHELKQVLFSKGKLYLDGESEKFHPNEPEGNKT